MGREAVEKEEREKLEVKREMQSLLDSKASPEEFKRVIDSFRDRYADYGSNRQQQLEYHLNQIQRLIVPTQITSMTVSSLHTDEDVNPPAPSTEAPPIDGLATWNLLCSEVGLSMGQQLQFLTRRKRIKNIWRDLQHCFVLVAKARERCVYKWLPAFPSNLDHSFLAKNKRMESEMAVLQSSLTPEQQAKVS